MADEAANRSFPHTYLGTVCNLHHTFRIFICDSGQAFEVDLQLPELRIPIIAGTTLMTPFRLSSRLLLSAICLLLVLRATAQSSDEATVAWLRKNAIPIQTVEAGHGFADLRPLGLVAVTRALLSLAKLPMARGSFSVEASAD